MHPAMVQRIRENAQHHRALASHYEARAQWPQKVAASQRRADGEVQEEAPEGLPEVDPITAQHAEVAQMHAEAAQQLEDVLKAAVSVRPALEAERASIPARVRRATTTGGGPQIVNRRR